MNIEVEGVDAAQSAIRDAGTAIAQALADATQQATDGVYEEARNLVPVASGQLRDAITRHVEGSEGEVWVETDEAPHGLYVEFGTSSNPEQPFMGPAAEIERGRIARRVEDAVKEAAGG